MSRWILWMLLAAALAVGCNKEEAPSGATGAAQNLADSSSMPPPSPRGLGTSTDSATNATVIAENADVNAVLQQLTQELRDFVVRTRSIPKDFEEFAAKSQVRFPPAPPGQKYAIQGQAVVLKR